MRRAILTMFIAVAAATTASIAAASPVLAHGDGGSDASNYRIEFSDSGDQRLAWRVVGADDGFIELSNSTGSEVVVFGYEDDPFLRFEPGVGVFENERSPATYLNTDKYAGVAIPAWADPEAEPVWRKVADGATYSWHDHRVHWMSPIPPPAVQANRDTEQLISAWQIPVTIAGSAVAATGELRWIPSIRWWPPLLILAGIFAAVVVLVAALSCPVELRWRAPGQAVAFLLWAVGVANIVRTVDDMIAAPATVRENVFLGGLAFIWITVTSLLGWRAGRGRMSGFAAAVLAATMTMLMFASESGHQLSASQLVTTMPYWVRRWTVAASYAIVVPAVIGAVLAAANVKHYLDRHPDHRIGPGRLRTPTENGTAT